MHVFEHALQLIVPLFSVHNPQYPGVSAGGFQLGRAGQLACSIVDFKVPTVER